MNLKLRPKRSKRTMSCARGLQTPVGHSDGELAQDAETNNPFRAEGDDKDRHGLKITQLNDASINWGRNLGPVGKGPNLMPVGLLPFQ